MLYAIIKNSRVIRVLEESHDDVKNFNLDMGDSIVPYNSPMLVKFRSGTTKVGVIRDGMFRGNDVRTAAHRFLRWVCVLGVKSGVQQCFVSRIFSFKFFIYEYYRIFCGFS